MSDLHTPFKVGQSIDDVMYIVHRTGREKIALRIKAKEGIFTIDTRRKSDRLVQKEVADHVSDPVQNFTLWWYFPDCCLKFKRYQGLDGKGAPCYRVVVVEPPLNIDEILSLPVTREEAADAPTQGPGGVTLQPLMT